MLRDSSLSHRQFQQGKDWSWPEGRGRGQRKKRDRGHGCAVSSGERGAQTFLPGAWPWPHVLGTCVPKCGLVCPLPGAELSQPPGISVTSLCPVAPAPPVPRVLPPSAPLSGLLSFLCCPAPTPHSLGRPLPTAPARDPHRRPALSFFLTGPVLS